MHARFPAYPKAKRAALLAAVESVRETVAIVIGDARCKHLRLVHHAAKGTGVHGAVAITLKLVAISVGRLGIPASPASLHRKPEPG